MSEISSAPPPTEVTQLTDIPVMSAVLEPVVSDIKLDAREEERREIIRDHEQYITDQATMICELFDAIDPVVKSEFGKKVTDDLILHNQETSKPLDELVEKIGRQNIIAGVADEMGIIDKRELRLKSIKNFVNGLLYEGSTRRVNAQQAIENATTQGIESQDDNFEPEAIICIPAAIKYESVDDVMRTFDALSKQSGIEGCEIVFWANYATGDGESKAEDNFNQVQKRLQQQYPNLRVRSVLKSYDPETIEQDSMNRIRSDNMDMVMLDAHNRGLSAETPVIWLDSDTVSLSKNTITSLATEARSTKYFGVRPNLRYTDTDFKAGEKFDLTNPHHIAAVDELTRRSSKSTQQSYTEECGFSFKIGDYAIVGGVRPFIAESLDNEGLGESGAIGHGLERVFGERVTIQLGSKKVDIKQVYLMYKYDVKSLLAHSLPEARVYTDARRLIDTISQTSMPGTVQDPRESYDKDGFYKEKYRGGNENRIEVVPREVGVDFAYNALLRHTPKKHIGDKIRRHLSSNSNNTTI